MMANVSTARAPTREAAPVDRTQTLAEPSSGRTQQSIISPKLMLLTLQELASRGREADPVYGKKKCEKIQALPDAVDG